ncbi:DUF444 family protein [bacterium]|nr:DUF444 family protein [bacterium]
MSIFKHHKTQSDRSASDRSRHKKKIERAIKDGVYDIVSDESIIGKDGKKKIKIPVRGIKEYRFVYGENENNQKVGSAPGKDISRGQSISKKGSKKKPGEGKAGNKEGEEIYEVEITLEELANYLFDDLNLPELEKKKLKNIVGEKFKRKGYRNDGIRPRLSKKETLKNKIKRKKAAERAGTYNPEEDERFPFHQNDLRYNYIKATPKENSNAVIFFMMDVSGSMGKSKKYLARSFFFLLFQFINHRYENTDIVFVAHTTTAKEVNEDDFFKVMSSGGTYISSAPTLVNEIITKRYHPDSWNIYAFHCSDGDNWSEDNEKALVQSAKIKALAQLYCFIEILPAEDEPKWSNYDPSHMSKEYEKLVDKKFKNILLTCKEDVWPAFSRIFGGSINE